MGWIERAGSWRGVSFGGKTGAAAHGPAAGRAARDGSEARGPDRIKPPRPALLHYGLRSSVG
jgi:hypothetical protein